MSSPTARSVPLALYLRAVFGGKNIFAAWLLLAVGIFLVEPAVHSELAVVWKFLGPLATTRAIVTGSTATDASEDSDDTDSEYSTVYAIRYTYTPEGSTQRITGTSYQRGGMEPNTEMTVEYDPAHPQNSCLFGMRAEKYGIVIALALFFPLLGLYILLSGIIRDLRALFLLRHGLSAAGILAAVEKADEDDKEEDIGTSCRVTFQFMTAQGKSQTLTADTMNVKESWVAFYKAGKASRQVRPQETILYHPAQPNAALLLSDVDLRLELNDKGQFTGVSLSSGVAAMIFPLIILLGYGWVIYHL